MIRDTHLFEPFSAEPISLMNDVGDWTAPFEMDLSDEQLVALYRGMVQGRLLDERLSRFAAHGARSVSSRPRPGTKRRRVAMAHAVQVGKDWLFPYYRDTRFAAAAGDSRCGDFRPVPRHEGRPQPGPPDAFTRRVEREKPVHHRLGHRFTHSTCGRCGDEHEVAHTRVRSP